MSKLPHLPYSMSYENIGGLESVKTQRNVVESFQSEVVSFQDCGIVS